MYTPLRPNPTQLEINDSTIGESIETKVERMMSNNEPIGAGDPIIYTNRDEGVIPEYNIRTDRFDLALDATDRITKDRLAKRKEFHDNLKKQNETASTEPTQTTPEPTK